MTKDLTRQRRLDLANDLTLMGLASILPHGGSEAHDQFTETLENLQATPDEPGYIADPHAAPDLEALSALPVTRIKKEDSNGHE